MAKLTLYGLDASPPVRAVLLTLKALDLSYDFVQINLFEGEHLKPEYLEKNPQHTVPTLEDDDVFIWDSHAIMAYLVTKYGENDQLYPQDLLQRAVIDQRLHFDSSVMFTSAIKALAREVLFLNVKEVLQSKIDVVSEVYDFVETFLASTDYVAANQLTIADFSFVSSLTSLEAFLELDASKYEKTAAWLERMKQLPYYEEANAKGAAMFIGAVKSKNFTIVE